MGMKKERHIGLGTARHICKGTSRYIGQGTARHFGQGTRYIGQGAARHIGQGTTRHIGKVKQDILVKTYWARYSRNYFNNDMFCSALKGEYMQCSMTDNSFSQAAAVVFMIEIHPE